MTKKTLKLTFRNLVRKPVISAINIVGFAIGIVCVLIIGLWIQNERSFDKFHTNYNDICRITMEKVTDNGYDYINLVPTLFGPAFKQRIPDVKDFVRLHGVDKEVFSYKEHTFYENKGYFADNSIFKVFDFQLISGNKAAVLTKTNTIALSEKFAEKYFGNALPIGKIIKINDIDFTVTGVFRDIQKNSHLQFEYLISLKTMESLRNFLDWTSNRVYTYLLLEKNIKKSQLKNKIEELISSETNEWIEEKTTTHLQPLSDVYLNTNYRDSNITNLTGDKKNIYIFSIVGLAILLISCINFINLYETQNSGRNNEIGINKILGAKKSNLIVQFLSETFVHLILASLLALVLLIVFAPLIKQFLNFELNFQLLNIGTLAILLLGVFIVCLVSGVVPATYLSSFQPVQILKGRRPDNPKQLTVRTGLVVAQFTIATVLLISTFIVSGQKQFLQNQKLGFSKEQVVYVPMKGEASNKYDTFKEGLLKFANIRSVTNKTSTPDEWNDGGSFFKTAGHSDDGVGSERCWVGYDYFETLGIKTIQGRTFSRDYDDNGKTCLLNKVAVEKSGLKNPIGKEIFYNDQRRTVIGVIDNVLTKPLHKHIYPQIYLLDQDRRSGSGVVLIKISGQPSEAISIIEKNWNKYNPEIPFEYGFLDKKYAQLYQREQRLSILFTVFATIAIILSCSGIFGISLFLIFKRTKEIGVRKVNGAKISEVLVLLNKDLVRWVGIAFLIAVPIAWYSMAKWLENFAYKISISWWVIASAGIITVGIALLTVSWQTWRAARRNPVEALRYE